MATKKRSVKDRILREVALNGGLVLAGLVLLPIAIFFVGRLVFGDYGGGGFAVFYAGLQADFRDGEPAALFLLLSPFLVWSLARLTIWLFRRTANRPTPATDTT